MKALNFLASVAAILLVSSPVLASDVTDLQCGNRIVSLNDHAFEVLQKCGEPTDRAGGGWFYDKGPNQFPVVIHMMGGQVIDIEVIDGD